MAAAVVKLPRTQLPADLAALCNRYAAGEIEALYAIAHLHDGQVEYIRIGAAPPIPPFWPHPPTR